MFECFQLFVSFFSRVFPWGSERVKSLVFWVVCLVFLVSKEDQGGPLRFQIARFYCDFKSLRFVRHDIPQSEITAATFHESLRSQGEKLCKKSGKLFWAFSCFICCAE